MESRAWPMSILQFRNCRRVRSTTWRLASAKIVSEIGNVSVHINGSAEQFEQWTIDVSNKKSVRMSSTIWSVRRRFSRKLCGQSGALRARTRRKADHKNRGTRRHKDRPIVVVRSLASLNVANALAG